MTFVDDVATRGRQRDGRALRRAEGIILRRAVAGRSGRIFLFFVDDLICSFTNTGACASMFQKI